MTETRIRWQDKTPGNGDVYNVACTGYVGTVEGAAFIIYTPDTMHADWLLSVRLVPGSTFLYGGTPDELKAEAERWLAGFITSLGAVFPEDEPGFDDDDGELLEVKYAAGTRVRFAHPGAGYPGDAEEAMKALTPGKVYTVVWADIGQSRTDLNLAARGRALGRFNSVLFEPVDDETPAPEHEGGNAGRPCGSQVFTRTERVKVGRDEVVAALAGEDEDHG